MLISHRKQFIYTKTYKTAGTSVEAYFEPYCMSEGEWEEKHTRDTYESATGVIGYRGRPKDTAQLKWWNHMSAKRIKEQLNDEEKWQNYFKFCVVRNPFDKVISAFHFQNKDLPDQSRWYYYRRRLLRRYYAWRYGGHPPQMKNQFKEWLKAGRMHLDSDKYFIDGELCVDYFIRYEDLAGGVKAVCEKLAIPFDANRIPHYKGSGRSDAQKYVLYDEESIALVAEMFAFEIEHFNYEAPKIS